MLIVVLPRRPGTHTASAHCLQHCLCAGLNKIGWTMAPYKQLKMLGKFGGRTRTRTLDPLIKSRQGSVTNQSSFRHYPSICLLDPSMKSLIVGMSHELPFTGKVAAVVGINRPIPHHRFLCGFGLPTRLIITWLEVRVLPAPPRSPIQTEISRCRANSVLLASRLSPYPPYWRGTLCGHRSLQ
jgi:hypothetical protein